MSPTQTRGTVTPKLELTSAGPRRLPFPRQFGTPATSCRLRKHLLILCNGLAPDSFVPCDQSGWTLDLMLSPRLERTSGSRLPPHEGYIKDSVQDPWRGPVCRPCPLALRPARHPFLESALVAAVL